MWDLDSFPAVSPGGQTAITGEIYEIDEPMLASLDRLEEVPALYQRGEIATPHGTAWFYVVHSPPEGRTVIADGEWDARAPKPCCVCLLCAQHAMPRRACFQPSHPEHPAEWLPGGRRS